MVSLLLYHLHFAPLGFLTSLIHSVWLLRNLGKLERELRFLRFYLPSLLFTVLAVSYLPNGSSFFLEKFSKSVFDLWLI
jgi:hypothetical protein